MVDERMKKYQNRAISSASTDVATINMVDIAINGYADFGELLVYGFLKWDSYEIYASTIKGAIAEFKKLKKHFHEWWARFFIQTMGMLLEVDATALPPGEMTLITTHLREMQERVNTAILPDINDAQVSSRDFYTKVVVMFKLNAWRMAKGQSRLSWSSAQFVDCLNQAMRNSSKVIDASRSIASNAFVNSSTATAPRPSRVCHDVFDHVLQSGLDHRSGFLIDLARDSLHSAPPRHQRMAGLVIPEMLPLPPFRNNWLSLSMSFVPFLKNTSFCALKCDD